MLLFEGSLPRHHRSLLPTPLSSSYYASQLFTFVRKYKLKEKTFPLDISLLTYIQTYLCCLKSLWFWNSRKFCQALFFALRTDLIFKIPLHSYIYVCVLLCNKIKITNFEKCKSFPDLVLYILLLCKQIYVLKYINYHWTEALVWDPDW